MEFEWDPDKSDRCYEERGFDFAHAAQGFFDPDRIVIKDNRYDYGENRYLMISKIQERVFVVIFTPRDNAIRIISARKANQREVKQYETTSHDD
ncbi:BrnT family toxin [Desulfotignum phosphitoxidans]|nr:BrnT family toxin [Desulfotignum phosphitoxidans]